MKRRAWAVLATVPLLTLAACGSDGSGGDGSAAPGTLAVTTSFYPLQYAVEQVGGSHVSVTNLTKPGVEPHDLELTPKDLGQLREADLVVYLAGFQPAVDDAVAEAPVRYDVAPAAEADLAAADDGHAHETQSGSEHIASDPHFWLDPMRYASVVDALAQELGKVDPANASSYTANATRFHGELSTLDEEFHTGLKSCQRKDLVTAHAAFGYLAEAYGLHQVGITGLNPESEPSAKQMADVVAHIKETGTTTVYAETLLPKDVAETIAREAGAKVAVLDPLEGLTDQSAGTTYLEVMRANLATLQQGQSCS